MMINNKLIIFYILFAFSVKLCLTQEVHTFIHPGGWVTIEDIHRIRTELQEKTPSMVHSMEALMKLKPDYDYIPRPVEEVIREAGGVGETDKHLRYDSSHALTLMIKWIATNDSRYGDAAIRVIDGWSAVIKKISGHDAKLASGIYGNKFAQAAELAAYYNPHWANKKRAQLMFHNVFYPVIMNGADDANGNWGTACMTGIASMSVFLDNQTMFEQSINAYKHGFKANTGCAGLLQYIDQNGQNEESGRDQAHSQLGISYLLTTAVTAWNQKVRDLFTYGNHRLSVGFDYVSKYNLGNEVIYQPFKTCGDGKTHNPDGISNITRGVFRPIYEMANHFFSLNNISVPYVKQVLESKGYRPEGIDPNYDHPGLGTFLYSS